LSREEIPSDPFAPKTGSDFPYYCTRSRIIDVRPEKGTCTLEYESTIGQRNDVHIPLLAFSFNVKSPDQSAWMRYMPQIGDVVLISFDANGTPYIIGYDTLSYEELQKQDSSKLPGFVFRQLKWGEFDCRSAGMAGWFASRAGTLTLFAGDQNFKLYRTTRQVDANFGLFKLSSDDTLIRLGDAKRKKTPLDVNESGVIATGLQLKEANFDVNQTLAFVKKPVARFSFGNVIEEPTLLSAAVPMKGDLSGDPVRWHLELFDTTGFISAFKEQIDDHGNVGITMGVLATTGLKVDATVSPFEISNKNLDWSCLTGIKMSTAAGGVLLSATAGNASLTTSAGIAELKTALGVANVDGTVVKFGNSAAAIQSLMLGTTFGVNLTQFLVKLTSFLAALGTTIGQIVPVTGIAPSALPPFAKALAEMLVQVTAFQATLVPGVTLSIKSFTE